MHRHRRVVSATCLLSTSWIGGIAQGQPSDSAGDGNRQEPEPLLQELFIGDVAYPQEKGQAQVIFSASSFRDAALDGKTLSLGVEYGLTDRFQISMEIPYLFEDPAEGNRGRGIGDIELGALLNFIRTPGVEPLLISAALQVSLPTGDAERGLGEGNVTWTPAMLLSKRIGSAEVYLEAGGQFSKGESSFEYGMAGAYPLGRWRAVLEVSGSADANADPRYLVPGVFWQPAGSAQVGLGIPVGLTDDAADWGVIFKLIIELGGE